ncbi:MAG: hypothetical protein HQK53_19185, partial [Oligoflexia bacterium]|nr:hypothetical protein [Oligoflexia bacterium]
FSKELENSLLQRQVDLVVHSFKDLSNERPPGIITAAISERKIPNDLLLLPEVVATQLASGKWTGHRKNNDFVVGSSSPRRMLLAQAFLQRYFSLRNPQINVVFRHLRGNVTSRLDKLLTNNDFNNFDGIILAAAGLERLQAED